jgi:menaquinone-dependent protoporphyrinogen IX oxidase
MNRVRVLVVYGASGSGPDDLARKLAEALTREGILSEACAADDVDNFDAYDAVMVEDSRDAGHWRSFACRFARRHASDLRNLPTWFLSSIPGASDGREREQVRRWARSIAASLLEPSPDRPSRSRRASCTFPGVHDRPRPVRGRLHRKSRDSDRTSPCGARLVERGAV